MKLKRIKGNWAYCLSRLGKRRLADGRAVMLDRIKKGKDNLEHVNSGVWLAENTNVVDGQIYMARRNFNPLIPYAEQAVSAHQSGKEFFLTEDILLQNKPAVQTLAGIAKEDKDKLLHKRRVLIPSHDKTYSVSWNEFGDDDVIVWHARGKKLAKDYGKFINDFGFDNVNVYLPDTSLGNIAIDNWMYRLGRDGRSDFYCYDWGLNCGSGSVFGVDSSAEGTPQKILREKVRISAPSLVKILKFSRNYVPEVAREKYEAGIRSFFENRSNI